MEGFGQEETVLSGCAFEIARGLKILRGLIVSAQGVGGIRLTY